MSEGDLVLFYRNGEFFSTARVTETVENGHAVASRFWTADPEKGQFDLLFFLDDVTPAKIPWAPIRDALGYMETAVVQSLTVLDDSQSKRVEPYLDLAPSDTLQEVAAEAAATEIEARASGQGFMTAATLRRAVEAYAMRAATRYYELRGYRVEDRSATQPFDLECSKGDERLLVEVKGTQTSGDEILLTRNEVLLAQAGEQRMALFIQHGIQLVGDGQAVSASGGRSRVIEPWNPLPEDLSPIAFRCRVRMT